MLIPLHLVLNTISPSPEPLFEFRLINPSNILDVAPASGGGSWITFRLPIDQKHRTARAKEAPDQIAKLVAGGGQ